MNPGHLLVVPTKVNDDHVACHTILEKKAHNLGNYLLMRDVYCDHVPRCFFLAYECAHDLPANQCLALSQVPAEGPNKVQEIENLPTTAEDPDDDGVIVVHSQD